MREKGMQGGLMSDGCLNQYLNLGSCSAGRACVNNFGLFQNTTSTILQQSNNYECGTAGCKSIFGSDTDDACGIDPINIGGCAPPEYPTSTLKHPALRWHLRVLGAGLALATGGLVLLAQIGSSRMLLGWLGICSLAVFAFLKLVLWGGSWPDDTMLVQSAGLFVLLSCFVLSGCRLLNDGPRRAKGRMLLAVLGSAQAIFAHAIGVEFYRGGGPRIGGCKLPFGRTCHDNVCRCYPRPLNKTTTGAVTIGTGAVAITGAATITKARRATVACEGGRSCRLRCATTSTARRRWGSQLRNCGF